MPKVRFSISGEYLTDVTRSMVLSGNWQGGIRVLSEGNEGALPLIMKILQGDAKLTGADENIVAEEEDDKEYKQELEKFYAGFSFINGKWVKPYGTVNTITSQTVLTEQRMLFYKQDDNDVFEILNLGDGPKTVIFRSEYDESEREIVPPIWMQESLKTSSEENVKKFIELKGNVLEELGISKDFVEDAVKYKSQKQKEVLEYLMDLYDRNGMISDKAFEEEQRARENLFEKTYLEVIKEKIEHQETEWIYLDNLRIPKTPLFLWASTAMHIHLENVKPWKPISASNTKMYGDNPIHTDWVIGAGLDPNNFYSSKEEEKILKFLFSLSHQKMLVINGKGSVSGTITKNPENVTEDSILVIPHAGVEFFEAAKKAKAVISAVGGPAAHLVVNSKEYNINFAIVLNAMSIFKEGQYCSLYLDIGKFSE